METSTAKGFEGIPTGIRRLVLAGNKDEIPHVLYIVNPKTNERFELLVTIAGRILLCFECKHTGHCRSECFTTYCRRCGTYGHTFESCTSANTYSSAVMWMWSRLFSTCFLIARYCMGCGVLLKMFSLY